MGVDKSLMKDVLMMDMLSTSIGLKTFVKPKTMHFSGKSQFGRDHDEEFFYEPILHRGAKLPATGFKIFQLESESQKLVTLEVFEELETGEVGTEGAVSQTVWQPMGEFTCAVPRSCSANQTCANSDSIENSKNTFGPFVSVNFNMSESGYLRVSVSPAPHAGNRHDMWGNSNSINDDDMVDGESVRATQFLIGIIALLIVVYVVVKLYFPEGSTEKIWDSPKSLQDIDYKGIL